MSFIKRTQNQGVQTIALNRPDKRNAFHPGMIGELTVAFHEAAQDAKLRAVLLTAEGPSFCAGGDLEWMKSMASYTFEQNKQDAEALFEMYWAIRSCPVPVIGRVFGHAFGGGGGMVAVCDIIAAETSTQFCFSEIKWGLVPSVISPFVIEKIQPTFLREWFMTAKVFQAQEARDGGLIHFSGSMAEVDRYLEETIKRILNSAPQAVRDTKALIQSASPIDWPKMRVQVIELIARRRVSEEGQKGLQAFLDKKTPKWSEPPYGAPAKN